MLMLVDLAMGLDGGVALKGLMKACSNPPLRDGYGKRS